MKKYNQLFKKARNHYGNGCFAKMAEHWLQNKWPDFFTTRRILLGAHAERFLAQIDYIG